MIGTGGPALRIGPRHRSRRPRRPWQRPPGGPPPSPARRLTGAVTEIVVVVAIALVLSLFIKSFLVQAFSIPSGSMENTLLVGDRVLVNKLPGRLGELHRGDPVVFKDPGGWLTEHPPPPSGGLLGQVLTFVGLLPQDAGTHLIKRVIGLGGDTVACCDTRGRVRVNGVGIDEPYVFPGESPSLRTFSVKVPAGQLWVMGDHREVSEDSRAHQNLRGGFVPVADVVGRAFVIVWPFGRIAGLGLDDAVFARVPDRPR